MRIFYNENDILSNVALKKGCFSVDSEYTQLCALRCWFSRNNSMKTLIIIIYFYIENNLLDFSFLQFCYLQCTIFQDVTLIGYSLVWYWERLFALLGITMVWFGVHEIVGFGVHNSLYTLYFALVYKIWMGSGQVYTVILRLERPF